MDNIIKNINNELKKVIAKLKPNSNALSLVILTGKEQQGTSSLLKQSNFEAQIVGDDNSLIFYNQQGIVLNFSEYWLNTHNYSISTIFKKINSRQSAIKINGLIFCIDINALLTTNPKDLKTNIDEQISFLEKNIKNLTIPIKFSIIFTKLDLVAGFCDFFQNEHNHDIQKAFGFSLTKFDPKKQRPANFNQQFENFIETLNQQVISKVHAIRSNIKRTLIREFPLQIASLRGAILSIIKQIPFNKCSLVALYFTSSEQGGSSIDRLNAKIKQEFALTLQDKYQNAKNHRAYFISGALSEFQTQTKEVLPNLSFSYKTTIGTITALAAISATFIINNYFQSTKVLDKVSKELIAYETLGKNTLKKDLATYHLNQAYKNLDNITANNISIQKLKISLKNNITNKLKVDFTPQLLTEIETKLADPNVNLIDKYKALKVYLMLGDRKHAKSLEISNWFNKNWQEKYSKKQTQKKLALLNKILTAEKPLKINQQIVTDTRNYLNSLPTTYLFYTLAKNDFSKNSKKIEYQGFVIGADKIPEYLTKNEFVKTINQIPSIVKKFHDENWVLTREDLQELPNLLQQAYCYEYVIFWQNFINKSHPIHAQSFNDIHTLTKILRESNIIKNVISVTQNATSPITDNTDLANLFNQEIASKFSDINLVGESSIQNLILSLNELEKYVSTLAIVNDNGKTSYNLARARFQNDDMANPISSLFNQAKQLPKPISSWTEQIAGDVWYAIINDCREYINLLWKQQILPEYQTKIANRFPFTNSETDEISIYDFNNFFAKNGILNNFINEYLKPFLDTANANWQPKELNHYMLPINKESINELIRANVITNMFFANTTDKSRVDFSLEKINLDPNVNSLELKIGKIKMYSSRDLDDEETKFTWPETNATLILNSIDGHHYELDELGPWAFFKILQKLNVLVNEEDSSQMQILFEINGNAGRYTLKAQNQVNPFIPGILNEFRLPETIT